MNKQAWTIAVLFLLATVSMAQINNGGGGSGSGTVSANSGSAGAVANYAAAGGSTTVGPSAVTYVSPTLTIPGSGVNGQLGLGGSTSGTATITAPAVAGTSTNPFSLSNILATPNGSCSAAAHGFTANANYGTAFSTANSNSLLICSTGSAVVAYAYSAGNGFTVASNWPGVMWASGTDASANGLTIDTSVNRVAANIVGAGTSNAAPSSTGSFAAASFQSRGTKFTQDTGCGTIVTSSGGATAGQFTTVGSTSCTTVITFGNTATSPNHWACFAHDLTTTGDYNNPHVSSNTTTATIVTGTIASGDVIEFACIGY